MAAGTGNSGRGSSGHGSSGHDATDGQGGAVGRLSQIGSRTTLMAIDNLLRALPKGDSGHADAALEAAIIARRLAQTTRDFAAAMQPETEPAA